MAASHDYRGYLRNSVDLEANQHHRFHSETTYRPLLFGTLAIMGLLQVASSMAILLHLTGYLQEVDLSTGPHRPIEEIQPEPIVNALQATQRRKPCKNRCKTPARDRLPSAHLPIKTQEYRKGVEKEVAIEWNEKGGYIHHLKYDKGKLLVEESGFYYVYAKTCFRYYDPAENSHMDVSNRQLIQYIYHDSRQQNTQVTLMTTGTTARWDNTSYNMYCAQQGRGIWLEQGDALFVNVSNAWLLDLEGSKSYFGVVKLAN